MTREQERPLIVDELKLRNLPNWINTCSNLRITGEIFWTGAREIKKNN